MLSAEELAEQLRKIKVSDLVVQHAVGLISTRLHSDRRRAA